MKIFESLYGLFERVTSAVSRAAAAVFRGCWRVQSRLSLKLRFAVGFAGLALLMTACAFLMRGHWVRWAGLDEVFQRYLETAGHLAAGGRLAWAAAGAAALCAFATLLSLLRGRLVFRLFQLAWAASFAVAFAVFRWTVTAADILNRSDHKAFDAVMRNNLWTASFFVGALCLVWFLALLVALVAKAVREAYGVRKLAFGRDLGGEIVTSFKTGGGDPRWRSSLYWACSLFLAVLFLPYLIFCWGWEEPYGLPAGGGQEVQQVVKVKKEKRKKQKKLTVNPFSPYILERMNIDDVKTLVELDNESRDTYEATQAGGGAKGKGTGGWPQGMEGAAVRFIRLKYRGGDWDQDMGKGADYNLLIKFHEWTGMKIAQDTEFREIERLKFFPKKKAPPFVFLTGKGGLNASEADVKALRDYCLVEGGMLFIDNGGGYFDHSVRNLLRRVFPGKPLVDIANDDSIYQRPYVFPDGAPPFWHHAGYRAMGIRDEGRWVVYYHPGDINDAWRDDHSGASAEVADQAYKLGVNVMFYAFNQYYHRHYEQ